MRDFWLSCGHHLLDRDEGGGLLLTDDFLKVYLARPELMPPADACAAERNLHAALLAQPRKPVRPDEIAKMRTTIHVPVVADAGAFVDETLRQVPSRDTYRRERWLERCRDWLKRYPLVLPAHRVAPSQPRPASSKPSTAALAEVVMKS